MNSQRCDSPFQRLSDDLLQRICAHLDVSEILRLCLLNRQWARVGGSGYVDVIIVKRERERDVVFTPLCASSLWQHLYMRNLSNQQRYGILHFGFDRTQVWREEPAAKFWRRM